MIGWALASRFGPLTLMTSLLWACGYQRWKGQGASLWWSKRRLLKLLRQDGGIFLGVSALKGGVIFLNLGLQITLASGVAALMGLLFPPMELPIERGWIGGGFALVFFLFDDLTRYLWHRAKHRFKSLWRIHRLHHQPHMLSPLTLYRQHPLEVITAHIRYALSAGWIIGIGFGLLGDQLAIFQIFGAEVFGLVLNQAGSHLRHSHIPISFGKASLLFMSPLHHQWHHHRHHGHCNYGTFLSLWDLMFGSYFDPKGKKPFRLGIKA